MICVKRISGVEFNKFHLFILHTFALHCFDSAKMGTNTDEVNNVF